MGQVVRVTAGDEVEPLQFSFTHGYAAPRPEHFCDIIPVRDEDDQIS